MNRFDCDHIYPVKRQSEVHFVFCSSEKLGLHYVICMTDSFVLTLGHCVNFKAMRNESTSFIRIDLFSMSSCTATG